jgi:hypothetical protein
VPETALAMLHPDLAVHSSTNPTKIKMLAQNPVHWEIDLTRSGSHTEIDQKSFFLFKQRLLDPLLRKTLVDRLYLLLSLLLSSSIAYSCNEGPF